MEMMLGVNKNDPAMMMKLRKRHKRNDDVSKKKEKKNIKVTYISSPMKVKTSASNFRALVQELTGQDSNVEHKFLHHQEFADHDDGAAMAAASSRNDGDGQHEVEEEGLYVPKREDSSSSWLDLLSEDYCGGFQYSRSLFEPFNHQQYMKFDLVET